MACLWPPVTVELIINLKAAKALSLTISESFLLRADEVIAMPLSQFSPACISRSAALHHLCLLGVKPTTEELLGCSDTCIAQLAASNWLITVILEIIAREIDRPWLWLQEVTSTFFIYANSPAPRSRPAAKGRGRRPSPPPPCCAIPSRSLFKAGRHVGQPPFSQTAVLAPQCPRVVAGFSPPC